MPNKLTEILSEVFNRSIRTNRGFTENIATTSHYSELLGVEDNVRTADLSNPPTRNLVSWWTMNEATYEESDDRLRDSLRHYNATVSGTPTFVPGEIKEALTFDDNVYLDVGNIEELDSADAFTWHFIFKSSDTTNTNTIMSKGPNTDTDKQFRIYYDGSQLHVFLKGDSDEATYTIDTDSPNTSKQKVTIVYDPDNSETDDKVRIWLNGTRRTTANTGTLPDELIDNTNDARIGDEQGYTDRRFNGWIDEVMIWDRALNSEECYFLQNIFRKAQLIGSVRIGELVVA